MSGIGVVINPHAGRNRSPADRIRLFADLLGTDGQVRQTESLEDMEQVAREFHQRRIDVLAICGGDGSFFRTLSAMVREYGPDPLPRFLPLRAGAMNTIAGSVHCKRGSPERVLAQTVADYRADRPFAITERHLIAVDGRHFGFMVGAGVMVNFLHAYYGGAGRGRPAAARLFAGLLLSSLANTSLARDVMQRTEADIDCDDERVPHRRFTVIYASSITDIGLGFKPTYLATRKPGFFHLIAGPLRAGQAMRRLCRLRHGWPFEVEELYDNLAQRVRVVFSRPTQYMIDGDILDAVSSLDLVTGPRLSIIHT